MYSMIQNGRRLPVSMLLKLFDSCVAPILLYGAITWGFDNMDVLENVHTRFCKIITKKSKYCHDSFIYGELGRFLNYLNKAINGKKDNICFLIYNMVKHLNCIGKYTSPWLGYVKGTLENCGLNIVCISCSKWLRGVQ